MRRRKVCGNLATGVKNPYLDVTEWGWQVDPTGLQYALIDLYDHLPQAPVHCGKRPGQQDQVEADGSIIDDYRIEYFRQHIEAIGGCHRGRRGRDGLHALGLHRFGEHVHLPDVQALRLHLRGCGRLGTRNL